MLVLSFTKTRLISFIGLLVICVCFLLACAKRPPNSRALMSAEAHEEPSAEIRAMASRMNINTASAKELATLPGIGKGLAERIIEHREKYGPFRRTEHLIVVRGISDRRFRALRDLVSVG